MVSNLFGTLERARYLFRDTLDAVQKLVELKLASGMTAPHRLKDLADVLELVRAAKLTSDFAGGLDPFVREKYLELWRVAQTEDSE